MCVFTNVGQIRPMACLFSCLFLVTGSKAKSKVKLGHFRPMSYLLTKSCVNFTAVVAIYSVMLLLNTTSLGSIVVSIVGVEAKGCMFEP